MLRSEEVRARGEKPLIVQARGGGHENAGHKNDRLARPGYEIITHGAAAAALPLLRPFVRTFDQRRLPFPLLLSYYKYYVRAADPGTSDLTTIVSPKRKRELSYSSILFHLPVYIYLLQGVSDFTVHVSRTIRRLDGIRNQKFVPSFRPNARFYKGTGDGVVSKISTSTLNHTNPPRLPLLVACHSIFGNLSENRQRTRVGLFMDTISILK